MKASTGAVLLLFSRARIRLVGVTRTITGTRRWLGGGGSHSLCMRAKNMHGTVPLVCYTHYTMMTFVYAPSYTRTYIRSSKEKGSRPLEAIKHRET